MTNAEGLTVSSMNAPSEANNPQSYSSTVVTPIPATTPTVVVESPPASTKVVSHSVRYVEAGPVPSPEIMARYATVSPELPKWIMDRAENEQRHRHEMERKMLDADIADTKGGRLQIRRGQFLGSSVAFLGIIGAIWLGVVDQPVPASVLGGTTLLYIIGIIVTGERARHQEQDRDEKPKNAS